MFSSPTMRTSLALFAIASFALALAAETAPASSGLKRAETLFKRKEYERARTELAADTTSLSGTSLGEALLMFASLETNAGRAETFYRRAVAVGDPRAVQTARLELAKIRYAAGDYRAAIELSSANRAEGFVLDRDETAYLTGLCHKELGDVMRARAEFGAISGREYSAWAELAQADIDMQEGKIAQAIKRCEDIDRSYTCPIANFKLGECYEILGQRDKALDRYRDLIERFPQSLEAGKGREKIQLLAEPTAKANGARGAGAGEAAERSESEEKTGVAVVRGYTLQFGAFSARGNAVAAAGKLEKLLPAVRVESVEMDGRIWHRVRAGFYESSEAAQKDLSRAKEQAGLAGTIIPLK
jgi:tetratricopeptide (TPR) repeat protein